MIFLNHFKKITFCIFIKKSYFKIVYYFFCKKRFLTFLKIAFQFFLIAPKNAYPQIFGLQNGFKFQNIKNCYFSCHKILFNFKFSALIEPIFLTDKLKKIDLKLLVFVFDKSKNLHRLRCF